jgi:hypothetical protein
LNLAIIKQIYFKLFLATIKQTYYKIRYTL